MNDGSEFEARLARLVENRSPLVVGVRHHSAACTAALGPLLDSFLPDRILLELPDDLQAWVPWIGHGELEPPVALAATRDDGESQYFYPFASFSPELAAVRWGLGHGVPVEAFDLPVGARQHPQETPAQEPTSRYPLDELLRGAQCPDSESLWDWMVESPGLGDDPERVRRAALAFGLFLRDDALQRGGIRESDRDREAYMRKRLRDAAGDRIVAVVGSFHGFALLEPPEENEREVAPLQTVKTSLIPYSFALLDSRSGYPAGIRDPLWHERALQAVREDRISSLAVSVLVEVARRVRSEGHVAGVPDAAEALRMAEGLACLRGLRAPGRREVLEALTSALGQGEPLGRGRVLARALESTMVGSRRGRLPSDAPRSGLGPHLESLLAELKLPGPGPQAERPQEVVLDPLRSELDRKRHLALERIGACAIPYAKRVERARFVDAETLSVRWALHFTPSTAAMIELAGVYGVTLEQASAGALRERQRKLDAKDELTARARLELTETAAECGLVELTRQWLKEIVDVFALQAPLAELLDALLLFERIERGHVPGLSGSPTNVESESLLAASVRALEGLSGSTRREDAEALFDLVRLLEQHPAIGDGRMLAAVRALSEEGSPLLQGAATGVRAILKQLDSNAVGLRIGSWIDVASTRETRGVLVGRLRGLLYGGTFLLEAVPEVVVETNARLVALSDDDFLARLPSLREGFEVLSSAARARVLSSVGDLLGAEISADLDADPESLASWASADQAGVAALKRFGWSLPCCERPASQEGSDRSLPTPAAAAELHRISGADRWRLVLGQERQRMGATAARIDLSLGELYGHGHGEGSLGVAGLGGGQERSFPSVRQWAGEIEALFGADVREEVLGRAAERGSAAAALELDPGSIQPSVELLQQVLALKGGLGEAQISRLRPLVAAIVQRLVKELATRVQPALAGLVSAHPSRRPTGPLDLRRTLSANLRCAQQVEGEVRVPPEHPIFRKRSRRSLDWHLRLLVDISGSMEPSVIYSAILAAILSALPALTVHFLAFNTEILDLTEHVQDPLGLLLEVKVGGGTSIGLAVRYARERLVVPARTMVLVVSDFEEGLPVSTLLAEVRSLVETGARVLGLAALDDAGKPRFSRAVAELLVDAGMPVAALTPQQLARWIAEQIR